MTTPLETIQGILVFISSNDWLNNIIYFTRAKHTLFKLFSIRRVLHNRVGLLRNEVLGTRRVQFAALPLYSV